MNTKEKLLAVMKKRGIKTPMLSKQTGIPADRIYKWFQQGTNIKADDVIILEKWINGEEITVQVTPSSFDDALFSVLLSRVSELLAIKSY